MLKEAGVDGEHLFEEKASGAKKDRPELKAMLRHVHKGDTVVVTRLDRVARSTKHLLQIVETLDAKEVTFKILNLELDTGTPTGRMMLTLVGCHYTV